MTEDAPGKVTGRLSLTRREKWWLAVYPVVTIGFVLLLVKEHRWTSLVLWAVLLVFVVVRRARPPTTVDAEGIARPWRRQAFLPWSLVDHVLQPGYEQAVRIVTTTGRTIRLDGVDASRTDEVAEIGGRPLKAESAPVPKPIERERTQREIEADVARRAALLADERRRISGSTSKRERE